MGKVFRLGPVDSPKLSVARREVGGMDEGESDRDGEVTVPSPFEALMLPDESLAILARVAPSTDSVHAACFAKPALLSDAGRIDLLDVLRREEGFDAARKLELLAAISRADGSKDQ
ncbi:MAG: hypothetical protein ACR2KJ_13470, partial [Jatrophihabitans sp.]